MLQELVSPGHQAVDIVVATLAAQVVQAPHPGEHQAPPRVHLVPHVIDGAGGLTRPAPRTVHQLLSTRRRAIYC